MQELLDQRFRRVIDILGLERDDLDYHHVPEKVMFLYDWAEARAKSTDMGKVLSKIGELRKSMGTTLRGRPLLTDMHKYAKFDAHKIEEKQIRDLARQTQEEKEMEMRQAKRDNSSRIKAWQGVKEGYELDQKKAEQANTRKFNYLQRMAEIKSQKEQPKLNVKDVTQEQSKPEEIKI